MVTSPPLEDGHGLDSGSATVLLAATAEMAAQAPHQVARVLAVVLSAAMAVPAPHQVVQTLKVHRLVQGIPGYSE